MPGKNTCVHVDYGFFFIAQNDRFLSIVGMRNFQDTFKTRKRSFISAFSIYMTVPLTLEFSYSATKSQNMSRTQARLLLKSPMVLYSPGSTTESELKQKLRTFATLLANCNG